MSKASSPLSRVQALAIGTIVEAHGGSITAFDTPGGGATLTVEVPEGA